MLGGDTPTLKKCFKDENDAITVFRNEMRQNLAELQKHGVFLSFSTDPLLPKTKGLTIKSMEYCILNHVPVKVLTKRTDWFKDFDFELFKGVESEIAFGFTLTGHDELEPKASPNKERIQLMEILHHKGFKTFASIEPIIDLDSSRRMIEESLDICDLFKIGLESGKSYDKRELEWFVLRTMCAIRCNNKKAYFKDSLIKAIGATREDMKLWQWGSCLVDRDYNLFESE